MKNRTKSSAPALDRGIDVIELVASSREPISFSDLLSSLGIPRASLARILSTLRKRGLIEKDESSGRYRLGIKLLYLGHRLQEKIPLRCVALPYMHRLAEIVQETVELSTLDRDQLVLIEQIEGPGEIRLYSRVGSAYPYLHAVAVGKIYLAHMGAAKRKRVLEKIGLPPVTPRTITDLEKLERELSNVLQEGYAIEDQELRKGVRRIAAPIYDHTGELAGCIGIAAPAFRLDTKDFHGIGTIVKETAQQISLRLRGEA
jgi:DNA-binding IclR family transcriptional regulator